VTKDDLDLTAKIAWAHLKEIRDYYTRLDAMEAAAQDCKIDEHADAGVWPTGTVVKPTPA
jgi:hypothetical protein